VEGLDLTMPSARVPFIDLVREYGTIKDEIDHAMRRVVESGQFILGPEVAAFEREMAAYCGAAHAIGVASGTDALRLALEVVDVRAGDEVITSPFTFVATAEMVSQIGAVPVFADLEPGGYAIDPEDVARKITSRTKAIMPVHLYGEPAAMSPLMRLADAHGLAVIEDAAQAIGAEADGRRVGSIGRVGCFSFYPTKNLGAYGDGGLVTTNDPELADRLGMLRQHGGRQKYFHETLGWSSRLDEIQAAVLRVKLRHLDDWTVARRAHVRRYRELLTSVPVQLPPERPGDHGVYHLFTIATPRRDELQKYLAARGIGTAVHYPMPLHRQPLYRSLGAPPCPRSEQAARQVLSLPLFAEMRSDELETVASAVRTFFETPEDV
jgi:dTDP-4-amino-4,6-dideoxygalactose transaminase